MIPLHLIRSAAARIQSHVFKTPLIHSPALSRMFGGEIFLKLENLQKTGSFKIRGATNKMLSIQSSIGANGVVAASAGNHAQGVALAAKQIDIPATIVMPEWVSIDWIHSACLARFRQGSAAPGDPDRFYPLGG